MLKFLIIVQNATKGFDIIKIKVKTEDDENKSPATMTPTKKTKTERECHSSMELCVGILKEVNEAPTPATELSEEDAFGMVVARTVARLSPRKKMLTSRQMLLISDFFR